MSIILAAARLATQAHEGQKRKYTGRDYIEHPARVAGRVALQPNAREDMVAAAFLHDTLEDTQATDADILVATNADVLHLVRGLTNPSKGRKDLRRDERKAMDREHLRWTSWDVKIIKLIDRIDNLLEMSGAPWDFMALYAQESLLLAEVIGDADSKLKNDLIALATERKTQAALP